MKPALGRLVVTDSRRHRRPRLAAITMARDEAVMLPRWVVHYSRQCGDVEALLVIDDNSRDGSTDGLPCPVIHLGGELRDGPFEHARMQLISSMAAGLLVAYDAVAFSDVDEFMVADPAKYPTLVDFLLDRPHGEAFGAMGLNLLHRPTAEPPLDPSRPLLEQRRLAKFVPWMCKPGLKRTPAPWTRASHALRAPFEVDPDLYLFHAKFADIDLLRRTSDDRRVLVETLDRPGHSSWGRGGDGMARLLEKVTAGACVESVPEFRPPVSGLAPLVAKGPGGYRLSDRGQLRALRRSPFVLVPDRFHSSV